VRVGVACELLARGESVSDTAHAVGFENLSFFTKIFKRYQGVTPSDFQKKNVAGV
jgi:AraC-like DNA-binding protein